ncbi:mitochondrial cardiolipin hydrolase [Sceloporus undulatus]|uniref:mitochondrial cardiolipin hydrolase n=1 Tax=Sceloporus undulatus TaxID=8520 RepID=UPI001C4ADF14|nr:mitochondrial cardiolipin hydrolase [Sceloporus undulatus]
MWGGKGRLLLAVALGMALEALAGWLRRRRGERCPSSSVREVLFFPSRATCVEGLLSEAPPPSSSSSSPESPPCDCPLPHRESALSRLLARLLSARRSLELCVFAFSSPQLRRAVILLHRRGVRVRVVTDTDYMALNGSQIGLLRLAGIQVRHDQETGYMHHKFAIVDRKILITGSLNWTTQAIQNNRENVLIVEDKDCVNIFLEEFEKIWEDYNPANYKFFTK